MMSNMNADTSTTETWYITFGLGTRHAGTYTEVVVDTVEAVDSYNPHTDRDTAVGSPVPVEERHDRVRAAAFESYGNAYAFEYAPDRYEQSIARYGMKLRERIGARRPDGSLVPVEPVAVQA